MQESETTAQSPSRDFLFVDSDWVADHQSRANVRVVEVDYDPENTYAKGHIPNAHLLSWNEHLNVKILDGGREGRTASGRKFTKIVPRQKAPSDYTVAAENVEIRPDFIRAAEHIESQLTHGRRDYQEQAYAE